MILSDISIHIYVSKILPAKTRISILSGEKAHLVNIVQMERDTWSALDILSTSPFGRIMPCQVCEQFLLEDATLLPIVAIDTMHIKCNNGPSFYLCIRCQILLLKMSFNQGIIKLAFSWHTSNGTGSSTSEFSLAEKVMINTIQKKWNHVSNAFRFCWLQNYVCF